MSDYIFIRRNSASTDVLFVFSHVDFDRKAFAFWKVSSVVLDAVNIVHVNTTRNGWYHNGIPDCSDDIVSTVKVLEDVAWNIGATRIFTFGASMGAYAAALFGCQLGAARVLMISAETILGLPGSRSDYYGFKDFDQEFMDIYNLMQSSKKTEFVWWLGEDDPVDLYCADRCKDNPRVTTYTLKDCGHLAAKRMHSDGLLELTLKGLVSDEFPHDTFKSVGSFLNAPKLNVRELFCYFSIFVNAGHLGVQERYNLVAAAIVSMYPSKRQQNIYHAHFARIFLHKQNYQACAVSSSAAVIADPNDVDSYLLLSRALLEQGKNEKAQRAKRRAEIITASLCFGDSEVAKSDIESTPSA